MTEALGAETQPNDREPGALPGERAEAAPQKGRDASTCPAVTRTKAKPTQWVELRIHGVSGTPPESMLDVPHVSQVAGDPKRRVFQRANERNEVMRRDQDGRVLEGYHWGNLTSGSWRQGLWLILVPFGIVNAAQFMLPPTKPADQGPNGRRQRGYSTAMSGHVVSGAMLRLIGLGLTCVMTFAVAFICMDLLGTRAAEQATSLSWLAGGRGMGLGLIAAVLLVFVLYSIGGRIQRFEFSLPDVVNPYERLSALARADFLQGDPSAPDLRRLHLSAGWLLVSMPGVATLIDKLTDNDTAKVLGWLIGLLFLAVTLLVVVVGDPSGSASLTFATGPSKGFKKGVRAVVRFLNWPLLVAAIGLCVWEAVWLLTGPLEDYPRPTRTSVLLDSLTFALVFGFIVLLVANTMLAIASRDTTPADAASRFGRYAGGLAATLVSGLAILIALGFAGAFSLAAAKAVSVPTENFPQMLERVSYAWGLSALLAVGIVVSILVWWFVRAGWAFPTKARPEWTRGVRRSTYRSRANLDFAVRDPAGSRIAAEWEGTVASRMFLARMKTKAPALAILMVLFSSGMAAVGLVETIRQHECEGTGLPVVTDWWCGNPEEGSFVDKAGEVLDKVSETADDNAQGLMWLGTSVLLLLALTLVAVGRGALSRQSKRRVANVLWDVIAFWPHSAHPFAPPPYSQLTVIHFRDRIRYHLGRDPAGPPPPPDSSPFWSVLSKLWPLDKTRGAGRSSGESLPAHPREAPRVRPPYGGDRMVVAAHSQGSLIALAAILWLEPGDQKRLGLVTHGSQLQVAFPRAFPAYVSYDLIDQIRRDLDHRWVNLYRETDHVAGPVFSWDHWPEDDSERETVRNDTWPGIEPPRNGYEYGSRSGSTASERTNDALYETGLRVCGHDWRLLDPVPHDIHADTGTVAQIRAHSGYVTDPHWRYAVNFVGGGHDLPAYPPLVNEPTGGVDAALPD